MNRSLVRLVFGKPIGNPKDLLFPRYLCKRLASIDDADDDKGCCNVICHIMSYNV